MGISILIVDDDKLLVEKLEETVNWSGIGIDMVFTANNIRQAQKLLEEYPIEMLLCDIDMPQGNGLELLEWIRYKKLDIECTFLSSYANFAYAQMALKLSSREYLRTVSFIWQPRVLYPVLGKPRMRPSKPIFSEACIFSRQSSSISLTLVSFLSVREKNMA